MLATIASRMKAGLGLKRALSAEDFATEDLSAVGTTRERVLPTGLVHVVLRLDDAPLRIDDGRGEETLSPAIVGGPRMASYGKDVRHPVASVGAVLRPGAAAHLFGLPTCELAARHTPIEVFWGRDVHLLREELGELKTQQARLEAFAAELSRRMANAGAVHPGIVSALIAVEQGVDRVATLADGAGLGPRRFRRLFQETVGLTPKGWLRLRRFQRTLAFACRDHVDWASVAIDLGFADQAHLVREFRAFSGITPGDYRRRAPADPNHVPAS